MTRFIWNTEYIEEHTLDNKIISDAGIELIAEDEIFVEHQNYECYYVSQYGRILSGKKKEPHLLQQFVQGSKDRPYPAVSLTGRGWKRNFNIGRAVADIYCPNFWGYFKIKPNVIDLHKYEAHHCDKNTFNNNYLNMILLPKEFHALANHIESYALLDGTELHEYTNPLRIVEQTNCDLYPDDIIGVKWWKRTGELQDNGYTMYKIDTYWIGLKYRKQAEKTKKQK